MTSTAEFNTNASLTQGHLRRLIEKEYGPNSDNYYRDADITKKGGGLELVLTKNYNGNQGLTFIKMGTIDDAEKDIRDALKNFF